VASKTENLRNLSIMGGTFDPIHLVHLKIAEVARSGFRLEKVIFVAAHCPPHKSIEEMECSCPYYAGDTIKGFNEKYGEDWQIYFITGWDALLTIINWNRARTYPGLCHFIAATRPRSQ